MMTVTQLAREARVSIRTVRFYEEKGIIGAVARTPGGQKRYDQSALLTLAKARLLKEAGMSVEEIRRTLQALSQHRTEHKARQQAHLRLLSTVAERIQERRRELQEMEEALHERVEAKRDVRAVYGGRLCRVPGTGHMDPFWNQAHGTGPA